MGSGERKAYVTGCLKKPLRELKESTRELLLKQHRAFFCVFKAVGFNI